MRSVGSPKTDRFDLHVRLCGLIESLQQRLERLLLDDIEFNFKSQLSIATASSPYNNIIFAYR